MWNLGTNSAFAVGPKKAPENLNRVGRSLDLAASSSPAFKYPNPECSPSLCVALFKRLAAVSYDVFNL
jgi:hypothetical protein